MGGGVAGLTAAHELVERGFNVTLLERRSEVGGRSRSYVTLLSGAGRPLGHGLPGEHGFRFFPGFYRHLDDTMSRIPRPGGGSVLENLVEVREELLAVAGKAPIFVPASAPTTVSRIRTDLRLPGRLLEVGLTEDDLATFANKLWQIATSCRARRDNEYEKIGWRDFVESKSRSDEYYWYLASGLTRALVAARARYTATKTMGNIALRLLTTGVDVTRSTDRVLNGPTNKVWIEPWVHLLRHEAQTRGGSFDLKTDATVVALDVRGGRVAAVDFVQQTYPDRRRQSMRADYFVSALNLEALAGLVEGNQALRSADPMFDNVVRMAKATGADELLRTMRGLQIYLHEPMRLGEDQPINKGHQLYLDSAWGLTSIAQGRFWARGELPADVRDILSVDISSWDLPGSITTDKPASECTAEEIFHEVRAQIRAALGRPVLEEHDILAWNLDASEEKLLVNRVGSWALRPTPRTTLENFVIAGDFTRTETDLACMEGANESARAAVNAILSSLGRTLAAQGRHAGGALEPCEMFPPRDPVVLSPLLALDEQRYERGLPWIGDASLAAKWLARGARAATAVADLVFQSGAGRSTRTAGARGHSAHRPPRSEWDDTNPVPVEALTRQQIDEAIGTRFAQPGRSDPMFKRWRLFRLRDDQRFLVPFHAYDADALIIYGRAIRFGELERLTHGTNFFPVSAQYDGKRIGFAELWVIRYTDTSVGPYKELVINFVVTPDPRKPEYLWRSKFSALVPMMDPLNRLFTPMLLLDEPDPRPDGRPGPIEYGNHLLGTNKKHAHIKISRPEGGPCAFECTQGDATVLRGAVDESSTVLSAAAAELELARELGPIEAARNTRQVLAGEELDGGLLTRDFRDRQGSTDRTSNIKAVYKFNPAICTGQPHVKWNEATEFGSLLSSIGFVPVIAAHDPHLKSVLYLDGWPTPDDA